MRLHTALLLALALVSLNACGDSSSSPTGPASTQLTLTTAKIQVDGTSVGDTYHHPQGGGTATRFEAHLMANGTPASGHHLFVQVTPPGGAMGGMGGMWQQHRFELWDDGTRGDPVAGDGIYCLEDPGGAHGFHHAGAPMGDYRYEFWGAHHEDFSHSNHVVHTVHVAQ